MFYIYKKEPFFRSKLILSNNGQFSGILFIQLDKFGEQGKQLVKAFVLGLSNIAFREIAEPMPSF
jgi:3-hydroxymyristoyl/3-hydroxydecanoyl-(acyl carrier protein) dehydratase